MEDSHFSILARSKLSSPSGGKDSCSLHRWVLLKNSIVRSIPHPAPPALTTASATADNTVHCHDQDSMCLEDEDEDSFLFPDAAKLVSAPQNDATASEAEWLDSLLESLDDDEDQPPVSIEDEDCLTPISSPTSSSDDLSESFYYSPRPPYYYPYPIPYPPFHPPLIRPCGCAEDDDEPCPSPFDALPYPYMQDFDDMSVPDAIEDDSDDESEMPIPMLTSNSTGSSASTELTSITIPVEDQDRQLRVFMPMQDDDDFLTNPIDILPLSNRMHPSYDIHHQEC